MGFEIWWIWMALAAVFLIGEILHAGFFLLWFSIGAAAAGVLAMLGIGRTAQLIVFILTSGILFVFSRRFAEQVTKKQPPGIGADRLLGLIGTVLTTINNQVNTGEVRIGQDVWRAISENGDIIPEHARVQVVRIEGTRAVVKNIDKEEK